jgi:AmmeMemoRadiSam system protein A
LGAIPVDRKLVQALDLASEEIDITPGLDQGEHSIEVQFPFLRFALPGVPVVPMVIGSLSLEKCEHIAQAIAQVVQNKSVLLVASSDMSHYPSYESACKADKEVLSAVAGLDTKKIFSLERDLPNRGIPNLECALCGASAVVTVIRAVQHLGGNKVQVLPYANSGDITGERDRVVGYGAAVFYHEQVGRSNNKGGSTVEEIAFTEEEKKKLFQIARAHIQAALSGERPPEFHVTEPNLLLKRGVFVTLTNHGRLRGCIGHFEPDLPLYEIVAQMAVMSATEDARFFHDPITKEELDDIDIKISILSPLKKIDSIDEIEIGKHGIWVRWGRQSGTYLPEVAVEMGWNREEFLEHCCVEKAGLPRDAWKKGAEIYIYSSQVLKEK